jgi:hypothetical protein
MQFYTGVDSRGWTAMPDVSDYVPQVPGSALGGGPCNLNSFVFAQCFCSRVGR